MQFRVPLARETEKITERPERLQKKAREALPAWRAAQLRAQWVRAAAAPGRGDCRGGGVGPHGDAGAVEESPRQLHRRQLHPCRRVRELGGREEAARRGAERREGFAKDALAATGNLRERAFLPHRTI